MMDEDDTALHWRCTGLKTLFVSWLDAGVAASAGSLKSIL